jgi:hypothetical protein
MFVSEKFKLVFFEVPRTGSNSITAALSEFDPVSPTVIKRSQVNIMADYHSFGIPENLSKPYTLFATHRNPYERLWSFWKHRHHNGNPSIFRKTSWLKYVEWACDPSSVPEIKGAMLDVPISEMFDCDDVDRWLRFDSLVDTWQEFGEHYKLALPPLGVKQSSRDMGEMQDAYDQKTAEMVAQRFAQDFTRFNYSIDSWKTGDLS